MAPFSHPYTHNQPFDRYQFSSPQNGQHPTFGSQQQQPSMQTNYFSTRVGSPYPPPNSNSESYAGPSSYSYGMMPTMGDQGSSSMNRFGPPKMMESERSMMAEEVSFDINRPMNVTGFEDELTNDDRQNKVKRAKSAQKITRNRKITSCLQCRERKQKCDRKKPVCSNCVAGNSRGGMCTYVDTAEGVQEVLANEGEKDAKKVKRSPSEDPPNITHSQLPIRPMLPARSPLTIRRLNLVAATAKAGRDPSLEFELRVRYARAAAIGSILFGTPASGIEITSQLYQPLAAVDSLKLPTSAEIGPLLDTYRRHVEWMCNVVLVDLNRARFESFLNWWHSNPQTLPADPPLIPLVLTILALAIQARRMWPHCTLSSSKIQSRNQHDDKSGPRQDRYRKSKSNLGRAQSPKEQLVTMCSSEKELLETAQRCIDVLQIACPSNWASAFSAPLDLVRASLLRGLWHMTELHLQFGGSCFATTMRLAHAASLNHDTKHWPSMGKEESQARRNIYWNVATFETMFSMRVIQPSIIVPNSFDTKFPDDYDALINLYRYGGLVEPYIVEGRRSHFRVTPVTQSSFDFHLYRFKLTDILIRYQEDLRSGNKASLAEAHEKWKKELPKDLKTILDHGGSRSLDSDNSKKRNDVTIVPSSAENELDSETHFLQAALLLMMDLSTSIQVHRPQADESGRWRAPEGQSQRSLEVCIDSAQRLISLVYSVVMRDPGPPFILYHQCVFHCFQAAIVIAIESVITSNKERRSQLSTARASLDKAITLLDAIAAEDNLRYVAEQAGRYAATLREIDTASKAKVKAMNDIKEGNHSRQASIRNSSDNKANSERSSRSEKGKSDTLKSPAFNVPRAILGVPVLAMAEGDGKMLGGQGYPMGRGSENSPLSSSTSPPPAARKATITTASDSITPKPLPHHNRPFEYHPEHSTLQNRQKQPLTQNQLGQLQANGGSIRFSDMGRAIQATVPELQSLQIPGIGFLGEAGGGIGMQDPSSINMDGLNGMIPSMQTITAPQNSYGIDFHDLQVFGPSEGQGRFDTIPDDSFTDRPFSNAGHLFSNQVPGVQSNSAGEIGNANQAYNTSPSTQSNHSVPAHILPTTAGSTGSVSGFTGSTNRTGVLNLDSLAGSSSPPVQSTNNRHQQITSLPSNISGQQPEGFDDAFAMNWSEWERAVERMLYMDR